MRCFVVAGFLLTSASRGPSAIAEPLVLNCNRLELVGYIQLGGRLLADQAMDTSGITQTATASSVWTSEL